MANKIDGVKISVNNDSAPGEEIKKLKETASKKIIKKTELKSKKMDTKKADKKNGGFLQLLISIAVTALIVGGAMFFWQDKTVEKVSKKAEVETETIKADLENRLTNLKSKVTGVETDNVELKKTLEDLAKKAELLIGSKKEYKNSKLGFSFEYPASFGIVNISTSSEANGAITNFQFENNDKLVISGVQKSYEKIGSSSVVSIKELKGYVEKNKKFYVVGPNNSEEFEVNPAQVIDFNGGKALLIDKNSFILEEGSDGVPVDIGDNVAFVLNLKEKTIPGLAIVNSDFGMMPLNDFVLMIESFEIK